MNLTDERTPFERALDEAWEQKFPRPRHAGHKPGNPVIFCSGCGGTMVTAGRVRRCPSCGRVRFR